MISALHTCFPHRNSTAHIYIKVFLKYWEYVSVFVLRLHPNWSPLLAYLHWFTVDCVDRFARGRGVTFYWDLQNGCHRGSQEQGKVERAVGHCVCSPSHPPDVKGSHFLACQWVFLLSEGEGEHLSQRCVWPWVWSTIKTEQTGRIQVLYAGDHLRFGKDWRVTVQTKLSEKGKV